MALDELVQLSGGDAAVAVFILATTAGEA